MERIRKREHGRPSAAHIQPVWPDCSVFVSEYFMAFVAAYLQLAPTFSVVVTVHPIIRIVWEIAEFGGFGATAEGWIGEDLFTIS